MEEMKCTYDVFAFSPRALLLRRIFNLLAHPLTFSVPAAILVAASFSSNPSQIVAAAFLLGFSLVLIRCHHKNTYIDIYQLQADIATLEIILQIRNKAAHCYSFFANA